MQKEHRRRIGAPCFPVSHAGIEHGYLREQGVIEQRHFSSLNTVLKTMSLKRSRAAGPPSTFMRKIAPSHEARKNSARSTGSNFEAISPAACPSAMHSANGLRHARKISSSRLRKG